MAPETLFIKRTMKKFDTSKYTTTSSGNENFHYSDFTTNLTVHPGTKDIARYVDADSVISSIRNILKTNRYERLYNPTFGGNLHSRLFELASSNQEEDLKSTVELAINNYEPRARVLDVVATNYTDDYSLVLTITIALINSPDPITFDLTVTRVR